MADCIEHISVPELPSDPCNGKTMSSSCLISSTAYTLLDLPANSTQEQINNALVLAINAMTVINNAQQLVIEDLEQRVLDLETP